MSMFVFWLFSEHQINELLHKLPRLDKIFEVHRKIGEGTFSSVYLGSLRQHASLSNEEKRWFAIKHLVPTAHPARIEHELRCLQDIGFVLQLVIMLVCSPEYRIHSINQNISSLSTPMGRLYKDLLCLLLFW